MLCVRHPMRLVNKKIHTIWSGTKTVSYSAERILVEGFGEKIAERTRKISIKVEALWASLGDTVNALDDNMPYTEKAMLRKIQFYLASTFTKEVFLHASFDECWIRDEIAIGDETKVRSLLCSETWGPSNVQISHVASGIVRLDLWAYFDAQLSLCGFFFSRNTKNKTQFGIFARSDSIFFFITVQDLIVSVTNRSKDLKSMHVKWSQM